ncbi:MAG TPA: cytochrome c [Pyrinomonadaceae bacterium]|jgi:mono/diheme cytochrome c family protein
MSNPRSLKPELKSRQPLSEKLRERWRTYSVARGLLLTAGCLLFFSGCRMDMQDTPRYEAYEKSAFFRDGMSQRQLPPGTVARGHLRADSEFYTGKINNQRGAGQSSGGQAATPQQNQTGPQTGTSNAGNTGNAASAQPARATNNGASTSGSERGAASTNVASTAQTGAAQTYPDALTTFPIPLTKELVDRGQERYQIFCAACHGLTGSGDGMIVRRGYRRPPALYETRLRQAPVGHFFDVITNGWGAMPAYGPQVPVEDRWAIIAYIRALQMTLPEGQTGTAHNASAGPQSSSTQTGGHR